MKVLGIFSCWEIKIMYYSNICSFMTNEPHTPNQKIKHVSYYAMFDLVQQSDKICKSYMLPPTYLLSSCNFTGIHRRKIFLSIALMHS